MSKEIKVGDLVKVKRNAPQHVSKGFVTVCFVNEFDSQWFFARNQKGLGEWYLRDWLRHLNWIEKLFHRDLHN